MKKIESLWKSLLKDVVIKGDRILGEKVTSRPPGRKEWVDQGRMKSVAEGKHYDLNS